MDTIAYLIALLKVLLPCIIGGILIVTIIYVLYKLLLPVYVRAEARTRKKQLDKFYKRRK